MTQLPVRHEQLRLRQLRLLDLIDLHGSLRIVGQALNLTQPAVSHMLKDLEHTYGCELVTRSPRGVRLTPAGRLARERVSAALAILGNLASDLTDDPAPNLRVAVNPAVMEELFPAALRWLRATDDVTRYRIRAGTVRSMLDLLLAGAVDCYIGRVDWMVSNVDRDNALSLTPLGKTDLIIVCGPNHPLAGRSGLTVTDLRDARWALQPETSSLRHTIETMFRNVGLPPPIPLCESAGGPHEMMRLAQWLEVLVCVPRIAVAKEIAQGELCVLQVPGMAPPAFSLCFVNLQENDDFEPLRRLRNAARVVMQGD